jgi:hypothetical protein
MFRCSKTVHQETHSLLIQCDLESNIICLVSICLAITFYPSGYHVQTVKADAPAKQQCRQGAKGDF